LSARLRYPAREHRAEALTDRHRGRKIRSIGSRRSLHRDLNQPLPDTPLRALTPRRSEVETLEIAPPRIGSSIVLRAQGRTAARPRRARTRVRGTMHARIGITRLQSTHVGPRMTETRAFRRGVRTAIANRLKGSIIETGSRSDRDNRLCPLANGAPTNGVPEATPIVIGPISLFGNVSRRINFNRESKGVLLNAWRQHATTDFAETMSRGRFNEKTTEIETSDSISGLPANSTGSRHRKATTVVAATTVGKNEDPSPANGLMHDHRSHLIDKLNPTAETFSAKRAIAARANSSAARRDR
jgi:hypothetical protein